MSETAIEYTCPFCNIAVHPDSGECPKCRREWYNDGEYWMSRPRRVEMIKEPEPGDRMEDFLRPISENMRVGHMSKLHVEMDHVAAIEVMGWSKPEGKKYWEGSGEERGAHYVDNPGHCDHWHPCTDRNQSRLVVEAAMALLETMEVAYDPLIHMHDWWTSHGAEPDWSTITPAQEVAAAVCAVRKMRMLMSQSDK